MAALIEVIAPVFLLLAFGYVAVWSRMFPESGVDGLMLFTQKFAIPMLLFRAISGLDLGQVFDLKLLASFYTGATVGFVVGLFGARILFHRTWPDSVAIGFVGLFSNSVLLGLPITERAYGAGALAPNYAIIAVHSPFCYALGITTMEIVRGRGNGILRTVLSILKAMFSNPLVIGIAAGFAVNLGGVALPDILSAAIDMMIRAALPAALFALGGVLYFYRPEGDFRTIAFVVSLSLILHPAITWMMGHALSLPRGQFRSAVLTAAMAPGVNTYVFASMYGSAKRVVASAVLLGTLASIFTVWLWLSVLG